MRSNDFEIDPRVLNEQADQFPMKDDPKGDKEQFLRKSHLMTFPSNKMTGMTRYYDIY